MPADSRVPRVLITGATGFVGLNLVREFAGRRLHVLATGRRVPPAGGWQGEDTGTVEWAQCDVQDREQTVSLARRHGISHVVHAAALTPTPELERDTPSRIVEVNLMGTLNALEAARAAEAESFLFVSSTAVYQGVSADCGRIREQDVLPPNSMYSACKRASEDLCHQYSRLYGFSAVCTRLGTAYGPLEQPSRSRSRMSPIARIVDSALSLSDRPMAVQGLPIGRDYIYIEDACRAIADLALCARPRWPIYNLSSDVSYTLEQVLQGIQLCIPELTWSAADESARADFALRPHDRRAPVDLTRLKEQLPQWGLTDLETGLERYVTWRRESSD